jgi:hypothetical protein
MEPVPGVDDSRRLAPLDVLETETLDAAIDSLLATDPPPHVLAAQDTGLSIPVPTEVPLKAGQAISGIASALDLCLPSDLQAVVEAWQRARLRRAANVFVRLRHDPSGVAAASGFTLTAGLFAAARR